MRKRIRRAFRLDGVEGLKILTDKYKLVSRVLADFFCVGYNDENFRVVNSIEEKIFGRNYRRKFSIKRLQ